MSMHDTIIIRDLETVCIIGTLPRERIEPQRLIMGLELTCDLARAGVSDTITDTVDYATLAQEATAIARTSRCHLLERLAALLAAHCLKQPGVTAVTVRLEKPDALPGSAVAGVSITRDITCDGSRRRCRKV
ncbi:MAG: dihydroneopterin aldolase [Lentisphaerae bacterium]|nr:dihydroneopterin aldolase [Lentisphaerota bacterium]